MGIMSSAKISETEIWTHARSIHTFTKTGSEFYSTLKLFSFMRVILNSNTHLIDSNQKINSYKKSIIC